MGNIIDNIILNENIEITNNISYSEMMCFIKNTNNPLIDSEFSLYVCEYFKDKIGYAENHLCYLKNGELCKKISLNLYFYETKAEIINHLSDKSKYYYFRAVLFVNNIYILYIYEKSNIRKNRSNKFKELGI